jgi:hypothetical protein
MVLILWLFLVLVLPDTTALSSTLGTRQSLKNTRKKGLRVLVRRE